MEERVLDGRYTIGRQLGAGGMGTVWEALDLRLERRVAIKVVGASAVGRDPQARRRFEREAKLLAGLSSPYIVTVHDVGEGRFDGQSVLYLVMELLQGRSVDRILMEELPRLGDVARWGEQICRALAVAHNSGVIHRDLKPANVMVESDGMARVLDFGIAAVLAESADHARLTAPGVAIGTPAYMSPEQIEDGTVDARSDLYAVGCLLYALVTGGPPFHGGSLYQLLRHQLEGNVAAPSTRRPGVPPEWDDLVLALLAKQPARRPGSAAEVAERLRELARYAGDAPDLPAARPGLAAGVSGLMYQPTRVDPRAVVLGSCPRADGGRLPLGTGQVIRLADVQPGVETVTVELDWAGPDGAAPEACPEVDASALVLDGSGKVLSDEHFVFYNNLETIDHSVSLTSVAPGTGEGCRPARITVDLARLDGRAGRVVFALSLDTQARCQDLSAARALHIAMLGERSGEELLCYGFPSGPVDCTGLTLGELTRDAQGWGFHAVSRGFPGGLAEIAESHGVNVRADADADADATPTQPITCR